MMQGIVKFRAWDKGDQQIVEVLSIDFRAGRIRYEGKNGWNLAWGKDAAKLEDFELMQYTGLKDKKGVEVYEGDILDMFPESNEKTYDTIVFSQGCFCLERAIMNYELTYGLGDAIVIGNIYENEELLK